MNKRQAKRNACKIVSQLIESYFLVGQPDEECLTGRYGWTEESAPKLRAAFEEIQDEMDRRAELLTEEGE